jgi:transposase-like protein
MMALNETNFENFTLNELEELEASLKTYMNDYYVKNVVFNEYTEELKSQDGKYICLYCGSTHTQKHGFSKQGKQRFHCLDCSKTWIPQTNTILFSTQLPVSCWVNFIQSLLDNDSLKVSADKANISISTAFRWRHKLMNIMNSKMNNTRLEGTIHLDETLYTKSNKNPNIPRTKKKRNVE